jgi:sugar-specific transcriptional regulator TrmB
MLTQEWMIKSLTDLGLSRQHAQIYVYLALGGPRVADEVAKALKMRNKQVNGAIESLRDGGLLLASSECPHLFSAVSFEIVLDRLVKANVDEADRWERNKDKIVALWRSSVKEASSH